MYNTRSIQEFSGERNTYINLWLFLLFAVVGCRSILLISYCANLQGRDIIRFLQLYIGQKPAFKKNRGSRSLVSNGTQGILKG